MDQLASPRAYSYIRFSTPEQRKGDSLRRQTELSAKYAREHGLELDEELTFHDLGVSAYKGSNLKGEGQLRAFLDAIDRGIVARGSYLLVESLDRISRAEILEALEIFLGILRRGITVVTLADNMEYSEEKANKAFTDLIISITIMSRAHEESLTKSRRLKAAWGAKRQAIGQKKLTKQCPAWLTLNPERDAYDEVPEKVAVVRQIIGMMKSGMGKGVIAKRLNQQGVLTIGLEKSKRNAAKGKINIANPDRSWYESYITKIVKSRALIGEFQPHRVESGKRVPDGEPVPGYFPRLLSDEEFALLQDLISERGRRSGGNRGRTFSNLFTGLAKCGYCGSTMVYVDKGDDKRGNRNNRGNRFLVCHKAKRGAGCHHIPWVYADFEDAFFKYAKHADFESFVARSNDAGTRLRSVHDELIVERAKRADLITKRNRLVDAIAEGDTQPRAILERIAESEVEIASCDGRVRELEAEVHTLSTRQQLSIEALEALREVDIDLYTKEGDERFLFRAKVNEHLRRMIERLMLFPGGTIHTTEEVAHIREELLQSGRYAPEDVEVYVKSALSLAPKKHERFFTIRNRNQVFQMLRPDVEVPQIIEVMTRNPGLWTESERIQREKANSSMKG